jgi:hypothetical protein
MTPLQLGMVVAITPAAFGILWRWMDKRTRVQDERLKAMGLAIQFLLEKSEQRPNSYVMDRLRDALKEG